MYFFFYFGLVFLFFLRSEKPKVISICVRCARRETAARRNNNHNWRCVVGKPSRFHDGTIYAPFETRVLRVYNIMYIITRTRWFLFLIGRTIYDSVFSNPHCVIMSAVFDINSSSCNGGGNTLIAIFKRV